MTETKWEYDVTMPILPPGATSPVMDFRQMTWWLNKRAEEGWEFIGCGQTHWANGTTQDWWVFRRKRER
jgi:hypothetical protein